MQSMTGHCAYQRECIGEEWMFSMSNLKTSLN